MTVDEYANGWIIACGKGSNEPGDSTLYIEYTEKTKLKSGKWNLPKRPAEGGVGDTVASGWFDDNDITRFGSQPWYPWRERIGRVVLVDSWQPNSCKYLFDGLCNCSDFNLLLLDTSSCVSLEGMFRGCTSVRDLFDLDRFNVSRVAKTDYMFMNCLGLKAVSLAGWNTDNIESTEGMFSGCTPYVLVNDSQVGFLDRVLGSGAQNGIWRKNC